MELSDRARAVLTALPAWTELEHTDPEYMERFAAFALEEVPAQGALSAHTRYLAILSALLGCQGVDAFAMLLPAALAEGVTEIEVKEIVYQATAYIGFGRVLPFLRETNRLLAANGAALPLAPQATTDASTRLTTGEQAQVDIFGEGMRGFSQSGPEDSRHINRWLSANCFGDYYTRHGLDYAQREMVTFCLLAAQGGCEPQLTSHASANLRLGNDVDFLIQVVSQCLPYIGYPRSLNALSCIRKAAESAQ